MVRAHANDATRSASGAPMVEGSAWHTQVDAGGAILEVDDLEISRTADGVPVVKGVDLQLHASEILALVGESGSGKTTMGLATLGHFRRGLTHSGGSVVLHPSNATEPATMTDLSREDMRRLRGSRVSYIPQDPALSLNPSMRVGTQIREVLEIHGFGADGAEREERVRSVLREVGLPDDDAYQRRWPHQLSGGQQQRIGIAMAFAMYPDVLVLDEPTTGLDVSTQALVLDTIRDMTLKNRVAGLYITHDLAVVAEIADRVAVMLQGELVEQGDTATVLGRPKHSYTRTLLAAVPDLAGENRIDEFEARRKAAEAADAVGEDPRAAVAAVSRERAAEAARSRADGSDASDAADAADTPDGSGAAGESDASAEPAAAGTARTTERAPAQAPSDDEALVEVRDLSLSYGPKKVLTSVDLTLRAGQCTLLLGESGSGKTTLSRVIAGLLDNGEGTIRYEGDQLAPSTRKRTVDQRREIQYVFQSPYSSLNPRRTIGQSLSVPLEMSGGLDRAGRKQRVLDGLDAVRLGREFYDRRPGDLSGGERQRAAIARALVNMPKVLICDEVTSALDVSVQASIIDLLSRLREERGLSMLFVTHNIALARHVAKRVAVLNHGEIVDEGLTDQVLTSPRHEYTKELLTNVPTL